MLPSASFLRFALRALVDEEAREMIRAVGEFRRYTVWGIRRAVRGFERVFEERGVGEFPAPDLARLVADVMVEAGYAAYRGDRLRWLRGAGPRPAVRTRLAGEFRPVVDRVLETLPEALETGRRPLVYTGESAEVKAVFAKFLDNAGYNWIREWAIKWAGLPSLRPGSRVVDVGAGFGLSTLAVLHHTRCRVIAVDSYPSNLETLLGYAEVLGLKDRVEVRVGRGEELSKLVERADAVVLINVLHWCVDPQRVLSEAASAAPLALVVQGTYDDLKNRAGNVLTWLLGSSVLPRRAELRRWIRDAGWRTVKYTGFPVDAFLLARR